MLARLFIDDTSADHASPERVVAFIGDRPVSFVLCAHIETGASGNLFPWESTFHPNEHVLRMKKDDLLALPAALKTASVLDENLPHDMGVRGQKSSANSRTRGSPA